MWQSRLGGLTMNMYLAFNKTQVSDSGACTIITLAGTVDVHVASFPLLNFEPLRMARLS